METAEKTKGKSHIEVRDLTMAYGFFVLMRDLNFTINRGDVFIIMGGSGCGKSTMLRHLIGLKEPAKGDILYDGESFTKAGSKRRGEMVRNFGVMYQSGALWTSMTPAENVALPLEQYTSLKKKEIREIVSYKLALVGLSGFENFYPADISGGMNKRAKRLDDLILSLSANLGSTIVVVTHELESILDIGSNSVFLDVENRSMAATGNPKELRDHSPRDDVRLFLNRGVPGGKAFQNTAAEPTRGAAGDDQIEHPKQ